MWLLQSVFFPLGSSCQVVIRNDVYAATMAETLARLEVTVRREWNAMVVRFRAKTEGSG